MEGERKPRILLETSYPVDEIHFSPDGRWLAYGSSESGRWELYLARFPEMDGKRQVSIAGGCQPIWRKDGRELFFATPEGDILSVQVKKGPDLEISSPRRLFRAETMFNCVADQYAAFENGRRFLVQETMPTRVESIHMIVNWDAEVRR
jgi:hypothetical protein